MSLLGFGKPQPKKEETKKGGFKIAVSSGLYFVGGSEELQTLVKKVGYALTRGTAAIEIASDIPHEINFTEGREIRYIAEHQGVELTLHGDLQIAFEVPDRTEWINSQDKFLKSIKSAVYGGCSYVNFHSCLREWLELFTYAGQRLEINLCDHKGRPISEIFKEDKSGKLADWFVSTSLVEDTPENRYKRKHDFVMKYAYNILGRDEVERISRLSGRVAIQKIVELGIERTRSSNIQNKEEILNILQSPFTPIEEKIAIIQRSGLVSPEEIGKIENLATRELICEEVRKRIGEKWYDESVRGNLDDAYIFMAHYLYLTNDPLWKDMEKIYEDVFAGVDIKKDDDWLLKMLERASTTSDIWSLRFKEFYYGVVAAKYLQGHIIEAVRWMNDEKNGLKKILKEEIRAIESDPKKREEEEKILFENIKNLKICFETPDARNREFGGRFMLWKTKQIYLAIKHAREALKRENLHSHADKIFMIIDWEHVATHGVDPFHEAEDFVSAVKKLNDENAADLILGVHSNYPSPLQPHKPIEIGDRPIIYSLLYKLRKIGLGKNHIVYLLFERGGGENPFKGSIIALRAIAEELEKDTPPDQLPLEFYGITEGTRDYARQIVIIKEHALEPLKGLLKVPEEDYTFLGTSAIRGGKQPEIWKKEELR